MCGLFPAPVGVRNWVEYFLSGSTLVVLRLVVIGTGADSADASTVVVVVVVVVAAVLCVNLDGGGVGRPEVAIVSGRDGSGGENAGVGMPWGSAQAQVLAPGSAVAPASAPAPAVAATETVEGGLYTVPKPVLRRLAASGSWAAL